MLDGGFFGSVEADPALGDLRGAGAWYLTAGIGMILLAMIVVWTERGTATLPRSLGWGLLVLAAWGSPHADLGLLGVHPGCGARLPRALAIR